ncbi:MAG: macro domain-containing protein, partial [Bacteroidales bacterium]|nr:macro domain-containing protein [Bacteroidales bacterium]
MNRTENLDYILRQLMTDNGQQYAIPSSITEKQRMMRALMNVWVPKDVSTYLLTMQDAELQQQAEEKGVVTIENYGLQLWQGDITRLKVDAIVNAANDQGLGCWAPLHNCIDNCIHSAAGIQLRKECNDQLQGRLLKTGEAM